MRSHCRALGKDTRLSKLHCGRGYNLHCHKFHGEDVDQELWQRIQLWKCLKKEKWDIDDIQLKAFIAFIY